MMKTWTNVEQAFKNAGIHFTQKDWIILCEIGEGKFYYSPQSGKWRVKRTRAWQPSSSVEDFIAQAIEYRERQPQANSSSNSNRVSDQKKSRNQKKSEKAKKSKQAKKAKKTKAKRSNRSSNQKNYQSGQQQELKDEVRYLFLELFDEKIKICNERNYKPAWIWISLLDKYLLTPSEIAWLCTVFDYSPGWAFHQAKDQYPQLTYQKIKVLLTDNRTEWLNYFNSRWQFTDPSESKQQHHQHHQQKQQDREAKQRHYQSSTQPNYRYHRYQNHLDTLQLDVPFSKQELKMAYRKKALSAHPDTGGTSEAFRKVHIAFSILSELAS